MKPAAVWLQLGFGLGQDFLQAWHDWRSGAARAARLDFIAVTPVLPDAQALRRAHRHTPLQPLADALAAQWPPCTRNLHRLGFDGGHVHLLLAPGAAAELLPQLRARVDHFLLDALPPLDARRLGKGLARLAAPLARLHVRAPLPALRAALASSGFDVTDVEGELRALYRPRFTPRRRSGETPTASGGHALIVGAGLAGCSAAAALAEQGWSSTLVDAAGAPAQQGSGNPAGLFHGIVNAQDGAHARFNRAAALQAQRTVQCAIDRAQAQGSTQGLLRLETARSAMQMQAELQALQLPADYVQALDAAQAGERCGLPLPHAAWFYPGGGWVQPAALARAALQRAGAAVELRVGLHVQALRRNGGHWQALDAAGRVIAEAATVVLANAHDALRLLAATHWPVQAQRGQISLAPAALLRLPRMPLAGAGYLLPAVDGLAVFGASTHPGDGDAQVREADQVFNLQRLARLCPQPLPSPAQLQGRVAWRCVADDRLPLIGAVPDEAVAAPGHERLDQLPRRPGLYLFSGLGSRGIAWCELGAQVLAARITGAPMPLEASLADALDPGRFVLRATRSVRSVG